MTTARTICTLALEGMNKLSPGETVDADVAAVCLRRLNAIVDDWSADHNLQPQDQIVAGAVTGASLTLATGLFAAIGYGDEITSMQSDGYPMTRITIQQYNDIPVKSEAGRPQLWVHDGAGTVFIYPAATANLIAIVSRKSLVPFADFDTVYTLPPGYQGALAAALAVALAPALLGGVPPALLAKEKTAMMRIESGNVRPAIISGNPLSRNLAGNILQGWN